MKEKVFIGSSLIGVELSREKSLIQTGGSADRVLDKYNVLF